MRSKNIFIGALALLAHTAHGQYGFSEDLACTHLQQSHPQNTFMPGSLGYKYETETQIWSVSNVQKPACVFVPEDAQQVSKAVTILSEHNTKFAVRGGGHMPVPGANSIGSPGVLLGLSNMTFLHLCNETRILSVGAGHRWQAVYDYLEADGLIAVGAAHSGQVGVSGFLLGGGLSHWTGKYGFGSDNVVKYECVLSNGTIVEATADNKYRDLFWALRAGGNSFCIVTRFDIQTHKSGQVFVGGVTFTDLWSKPFLDAASNFSEYGILDANASLTTLISKDPVTQRTKFVGIQFYDSEVDKPKLWTNFTGLTMGFVTNDYRRRSFADYLRSDTVTVSKSLRRKQRTFTTRASRDVLYVARDLFRAMIETEPVSNDNVEARVVVSMVSKNALYWNKEHGGSPHNIGDGPVYILSLEFGCETENEDAALEIIADDFVRNMTERISHDGLLLDYKYMNYAGPNQKVFESFGEDSLMRMRTIRGKYDPAYAFTNLMPGGWKVLDG